MKKELIIILLTLSQFTNGAAVFHDKSDSQNSIINVKSFGAKGDGNTDDYEAILKLANYVNKIGSGNIVFPKGTYYIAKYHTKDNKLADIVFNNCNNLKITGYEAVISVNGSFKRTSDYNHSGYEYSYTNAIVPLSFVNCSNLSIAGIEINGNVDKMTRDANVVEGGGFLIQIMGCKNIIINDVILHYAQTDGIYINGYDKPTINLTANNLVSANNARQGMSIINLYGGFFNKCKFNNTGLTGAYGNHSPSAGVDIEPTKVNLTIKTGHLVFSECEFKNNLGSQFDCTSPKITSNVILTQCIVTATPNSSPYTMILSGDSILIEKSIIDCLKGSIYPRWQNMYGSNVEISNCKIKSAGTGLLAISDKNFDKLYIHDNDLKCTVVGDLKTFFPYLSVTGMRFTKNRIFIPSAALKNGQISSFIQRASMSTGNTFSTESSGVLLNVNYRYTKIVKDQGVKISKN
jgi:hypothetical protein